MANTLSLFEDFSVIRAKITEGDMLIGIDEVGMSAIAGPIAICGVKANSRDLKNIKNLKDSKQLTPQQRMEVVKSLLALEDKKLQYFLVLIMPQYLENHTLIEATMFASLIIAQQLAAPNDTIVIDGKNTPITYFKHRDGDLFRLAKQYKFKAIPKADETIPQVSAAANIAKVFRDTLMEVLAIFEPYFDWHQNKGYYSRSHLENALRCPSHWHRMRFLTSRKQLNFLS